MNPLRPELSLPVTSSLTVPPALSAALRAHQLSALHFLWRRLFDDGLLRVAARSHGSTLEQRAVLYQEVYGCILGHSMGLGKTLTALCFLLLMQAQLTLMAIKKHQLRANRAGGPGSGAGAADQCCPALRVLVVCPKSCVRHWLDSAAEWVRPALFGRVSLPLYAPSTVPSPGTAAAAKRVDAMLVAFHREGGVLVLGYEEFARLAKACAVRPTASDWNVDRVWSVLDSVRQRLPLRHKVRYIDILEGADVAVLDEAHRLKRAASRLVLALRRHLRNVQLRLALTGTPLQNHLEEYNVMQSVVTGSDLDSQQFNRFFASPIQLGQCADSSYQQFSEMQKCVASLRRYFATTTHHCGPEELERALPPRREFVILFRLSAEQEAAYRQLLARFRAAHGEAELGGAALLLHHQSSHICFHPSLAEEPAVPAQSKWSQPGKPAAAAEDAGVDSDSGDEEGGNDDDSDDRAAAAEGLRRGTIDSAASPKLLFALQLINHITNTLDEKVVVFSLYLSHLRLLQSLLRARTDPATQDPPEVFSGQTTEAQRHGFTGDFQANPRRRVLLCSVRAGGVGINLTAANHCILLDVSWNPADDTQATYRIYRFGQQRPVTVYRLATHGTTEQVVFGYALQKSWMHKKIADLTDPTRRERHRKKSYFVYPCRAAIDDGASPRKKESSAGEVTEDMDARSLFFLGKCERECPAAATVLAADPRLRASLYSVVRQSFLLRDDSAEAIAEMESRFREAERLRESQIPIALTAGDESLVATARRGGQRRPGAAPSLLEECEAGLVDAARTAANHLIWQAVQRRHEAGLLDEAADTVAVVRETDRALCALLQPLLLPPPVSSASTSGNENGNGNGPTVGPSLQNLQRAAPAPPPPVAFAFLAEALLYAYQEGARHAVAGILSQSSFTKLRTYLTSRIPREAMAASSRRSVRSTLTQGVLEDALLFRPCELLSRVDPVELTYLATEMGLVRPLLRQCFFIGLECCLARTQRQAGSNSGEDEDGGAKAACVRSLLKDYFHTWSPAVYGLGGYEHDGATSSSSDSDSGGEGRGLDPSPSQREAASWRLGVILPALAQTLERCLDDLWPAGAGFTLPARALELPKEEARVAQAYSLADGQLGNAGFLPLAEAAVLLGLRPFQGRQRLYGCGRCGRAALRRTGDTALECPACHYNAEFAVRSDARCQQAVALFELSVASNLLDAFSVSRSFSTGFRPADCEDVWATLQALRVRQPVFGFVRTCVADGVDLLLGEYPTRHVLLLSLQSGVGAGEADLLRRTLLANARYVWGERLRRHVRDGLVQCFRDLIGPSVLAALASMPMMAVALSLHLAARQEEVGRASELLEGEASNMSTASWTGGRRRGLLRFACDGLVKLLYLEKVLKHCRTLAPAGPAVAEKEEEGGFSDLEGEGGHLLDSDSGSGSSSRPAAPTVLPHLIRGPSSSPSGSSGSSDFGPLEGSLDSGGSGSSSRSSSSSSLPPPRRNRQEPGVRRPRIPSRSSSSYSFSSSSSYSSSTSSRSPSPPPAPSWEMPPDTTAKTAEELEDEATLQQRSAQYWVAFCEVYGTRSVEGLTVMVEDEELGMIILPPPPPLFWVSQLTGATADGQTATQAIDAFVTKLIDLSQRTRLISE